MGEETIIEPGIAPEWKEAADEFAVFLSGMCAPPSNEPTELWAEKNVIIQDGPFAGTHFRSQLTPLAKWIFGAIRTSSVRQVILMISAQYIKTLSMLISFLRDAKEDPADAMWVMAEADMMMEFIDKRLMPYVDACEPVAKLFVRKNKGLIQFENMNLMLRGSNSTAKLRSDPVRKIYCDERADWKKGAINKLRKRFRTYPNSQEISSGTAGVEDDELHCDYKEGSQTRAHVRCLKCGHSQPIRFGRAKTALWMNPRECGGFVGWSNETNPGIEAVTRPDGQWDYEAVRKNVRFECENPACKHWYSNSDKYELIRTMHPHDYNPLAPAHIKSFGGSAFEAVWESCDWDKLIEEFLKAVEQAKLGNLEPLKSFITETLGEPWQDRLGVIDDFGFLETRKSNYKYGDVWAEEIRRFMAVDKQEKGGEHYWFVVRAFGPSGKSRLIINAKAHSFQELEEQRKLHKVVSGNCIIDSGYMGQQVYRFALSHGWRVMKGEDTQFFPVTIPHPKNPSVSVTVRRIWRKTRAVVYNAATKRRVGDIGLFLFADHPTKDFLMEHMLGDAGEWSLPEITEKEYMRQLRGERREEATDKKGHISYFWKRVSDNHYFDCEKMILIGAIASKTINAPERIAKGK